LQYQDAAGNWRTYSTFAGHENDNGITGMQQGIFLRDEISTRTLAYTRNYNSRIDQPNGSIPKPDPRTFRFRTGASTGVVNTVTGVITGLTPNAAMVSGADPGQMLDGSGPSTYPNNNNGMLYKNSGSTFKLADLDGTARVADGYLGTAANPMATGATTARPVILNRPFRSVAELGYVFRDVPWKSLNLFSSDSGDASLLELFSMEDGDLVAGKTNLNTPHKEIVNALLQGALRSESDSASGVSATEADTIAKDLVTITTSTPLLNRAELVTKFSPYNSPSTGAGYPAIKTQREATVRALASATQTRTWNLLIDLVAQSGRYPASPTGLEKFMVEGEKHCWMHVAIDRFTGEVLRTQLEVVDE